MNILSERTLQILEMFRAAFARRATFEWFSVAVLAMLMRKDLAGVTSFARCMGAGRLAWRALLSFFASKAVNIERIGSIWLEFVLSHDACIRINGRRVLVVDGIKVAKSGKRMPGNKRLHQSSQSNTKPEYITGHSCQSISVLLAGAAGVFAVPVFTRIFEGLCGKGIQAGSQIERLTSAITANLHDSGCYFVADAYYMAETFIKDVLASGSHVVTRARSNATAFQIPSEEKKGRGRPRKYGCKVALKSLLQDDSSFVGAESPVYGESGVQLKYRDVSMVCRSLGRVVKYIIVKHPVRGHIYLVTTDLDQHPLDVIKLYGLRFKIEVSFKTAVRNVGAFAYHFWTGTFKRDSAMKGDVDLSSFNSKERRAILAKIDAYHLHIMVGHIAQGIAQILSIEIPETISRLDSEYRRTVCEMPSEATVMQVFRNNVAIFNGVGDKTENIKKQIRRFLAGIPLNQAQFHKNAA